MFADKWRPTIGMITAAVIFTVMTLPLIGLLFFRLYENQLVRNTESELIGQAAMLGAVYARAVEDGPARAFPAGPERPADDPAVSIDERYAPIFPVVDLWTSHILPARPAPGAPKAPASPAALAVGAELSGMVAEAQRVTLAGFRLLDANGVVVGGSGDVGLSFAGLAEVERARAGYYGAALRVRDEDAPPPPIYSISRGAKVRVFVAFPVFVENRVRGVIYVSRTPDNILRHLYRERRKVFYAALAVLTAALAVGFVFVRSISRPMRELAQRAEAITRGRYEAIGPLRWHGTQELASLAQSFMTMAKRLSDRSDYLGSFASHVSHELKSPLTAIRGAAELMRDAEGSMTPDERERFLGNVLADTARIGALLDRLHEMARADNPELGGAAQLADIAPGLRQRFEQLDIVLDEPEPAAIGMSMENAEIVFGHLLENAARHGAGRVTISAAREGEAVRVRVADDGSGISPGNRARIFDPFFTTRRAEGGTGMGLGIVRALLRAHGGDIALGEVEKGAAFVLTLPAAQGT